jgi:hypothetical protein
MTSAPCAEGVTHNERAGLAYTPPGVNVLLRAPMNER